MSETATETKPAKPLTEKQLAKRVEQLEAKLNGQIAGLHQINTELCAARAALAAMRPATEEKPKKPAKAKKGGSNGHSEEAE